ncbi:uncharacterized protein DUF397 [Nocardiopsis sp. Huas11]|uniref:DUF397 domain-containing protein n=1 Tax=Nocardiopsis sp. Huas11 TaxID=2183912 RepID=UPI000EAE06AF|nr:DUF397 domain-containing protein [Nocardiopsis sp. Huas11]RKS06600.1 uncharacterized protein DUF397 [Nocardiopsis sp. Huas11]
MQSPQNWRKSSYSGDRSNCVEVADVPSGAALRDSQNPDLGHLRFALTEWTAFLGSAETDLR